MDRRPITPDDAVTRVYQEANAGNNHERQQEDHLEASQDVAEIMAHKYALDTESSRGFAIHNCAESGFQTIIDRYGIEPLTRALATVEQTVGTGKEPPNLLDVIKQLEPDAAKRAELYAALDQSAEHILNSPAPDSDNPGAYFAATPGDASRYKCTAIALRSLDGSAVGNVLKKLVFKKEEIERRILESPLLKLRDAGFHDENMALFASLVQERGKGDLRSAAQEIIADVEAARVEFIQRVTRAQQSATEKFHLEVETLQTATQERALQFIEDAAKLSQFSEASLNTDTIKQAMDQAADQALATLERDEELTQARIAEITSQYHGLMNFFSKQLS